MTLLEFFFILAGVVILITSLDIASKQKFNAIHFFIFFIIGGGLLTFSIYPPALNKFGNLFGVARGADVLVYISIIFLFYISLIFLKKNVENSENNTLLLREIAIEKSEKKEISGKEVFVIPLYNEEGIILQTINNILLNGHKNIIVVNDGSSDNSRKVLDGLKDKIVLINHPYNKGQGAALETGFEYLRRYGNIEYVITFDADGQHQLEDLKIFEKYMKNNPDSEVFLGSRFLNPKLKIPRGRKIILKLGILFTWFISGLKLTDTHNGYRVIKKSALDKIKITQDGMTHASEIIDIICIKRISFVEVPVNIQYTDYSIKKGQKSSNAIYIALKTIWTKYFR